jgi:hypothetical protein
MTRDAKFLAQIKAKPARGQTVRSPNPRRARMTGATATIANDFLRNLRCNRVELQYRRRELGIPASIGLCSPRRCWSDESTASLRRGSSNLLSCVWPAAPSRTSTLHIRRRDRASPPCLPSCTIRAARPQGRADPKLPEPVGFAAVHDSLTAWCCLTFFSSLWGYRVSAKRPGPQDQRPQRASHSQPAWRRTGPTRIR